MNEIHALHWAHEPHAYWTKATDPKTGRDVPGLGTHKFFRFRQRVELHRMELVYAVPGNLEAGVTPGGCPDRVTIECYNTAEPKGEIIFDGNLAWKDGRAVVELGGKSAIAVSIRCHWVHINDGVPSFHEQTPAPWTTPFSVFNNISWYGRDAAYNEPLPETPAEPMLAKGRIAPKAGKGQKAWEDGMFVHFESEKLKVSFSTVRPRMSFLGWDAEASGLAKKNLLYEHGNGGVVFSTGPWAFDFAGARLPFAGWGRGEVEVDGQQVIYRNLHCGDELSLDIVFTIEADGFTMSIKQRCPEEHTWLDHAAWRFAWDGRVNGSISIFSMPVRGENRNGRVENCGGVHATGHGILRFETTAGADSTGIQVDSEGFHRPIGEMGFQVGCRPERFGPVTTLKGEHSSTVRFQVTNIGPRLAEGVDMKDVHRGLRKFWPSVFGFRVEGAGFSNNAFGINAMNCMYIPADMAAYTAKTERLPEMLDLLEYTLGLALRGGPGYACQWHHDHHHDTAPALVISAGRVHQCRPQGGWMQSMWPWIQGPIRQILGKIDDRGRYICRSRPGNRGDYTRSCTAWDAVGMGNHVTYASALAYRALQHGARISAAMNDPELAAQCETAMVKMKKGTFEDLYNPVTGWLADWRSADGELHDHACLFANSVAICSGLLSDEQARGVMEKLEVERIRCGHTDFRYGAATQLWPIRKDEHIGPISHSCNGGHFKWYGPQREDGADTLGRFCNGCLAPTFTQFYLQAAARHGFRKTADQICDQMLESFDRHAFEGSHTGNEFFTLDGMVSGYEGTLTHNYGVLYAIGAHKGWIKPLDPEW